MYSKQLLIKLDDSTLKALKHLAETLGLKVSSYARMILKDYTKKSVQTLNKEDEEDIKVFLERRDDKGYDFEKSIKNLSSQK